MNTPPLAVGIDLGTTNSLAAFVRNGRPEVVRDATGAALVPSCLSFDADGSVLVGTAARDRAISDPTHTIFSVKRLMGRTLADLRSELPLIPHAITERETAEGRKQLRVNVGGHEYTPEELSALILREVRSRAGNPTKAVITVPAYFDDTQRQATRDAGRIAGLDVLRILNEPTAAALAYGLDRKAAGNVAIYDLGGGTFDCSILALTEGIFKVLSTNGDTRLGGDDIDRLLMHHFANAVGLPLDGRGPQLLQSLRQAAEEAKIALSTNDSATMRGASVETIIRRPDFEAMIAPLIDRSLDRCRSALRDAELAPRQIDEVVLVGGSTRIPYVRRRVAEFFGRTPHTDLNPEEVVALGAAIQAETLTTGNRATLLLDVVPLSLGIETLGGVVDKLVHRNASLPCRATTRYTTFADNQTAILLNIYQGERELTRDCKHLGTFKLAGIPPMPAQMPQVDVTFFVDANGMLAVSAAELRSGVKAQVQVTAGHGLSPADVERLVLESVEHAHADFATRQFVELKNKADADLRHTAKGLAAAGDSLAADERTAIDAATTRLQAAMAGSNLAALRQALDAFGAATQPLAERLMNAAVKATLAGKTEAELG